MRRKNPNFSSYLLEILLAIVALMGMYASAMANDLPLAAGSPMAGFSFDDRPLLLPVQRNFQMAMLTASSEIGRSCGKMESYGWRMSQSEQQRVNGIFNNTVDRLRALGYIIETKAPNSISHDITLFTADRPDKHFIFMWSAGEIGLVMVLCESSPPLTGRMAEKLHNAVQTFPPPRDVLESSLEAPTRTAKASDVAFSPVGSWVGDYTCMQGTTGGTLQITSLKGEDFQGVFRFYPTTKNRLTARGSYAVYGQYDHISHRILINPGKWLERPKNYYNTIIVGSFDPAARSFSGFFQGIMGCTSFEAKYAGASYETPKGKSAHKKPRKKTKKPAANPATPDSSVTAPTAGTPAGMPPAADGIKLPDNSATPAAPPPATPPSVSPPPAAAPSPSVPAPTATPSIPAAPPVPASPPAPAATPPAPDAAPTPPTPPPAKPTSSVDPDPSHRIIVALAQYNTTVPQLPLAPQYNTSVPQLAQAPQYNTSVPEISQAPVLGLPEHAPLPNYVALPGPEDLRAPEWPLPETAPGPVYANTTVPEYNTSTPQLPLPEIYTDP